MVSAPLSPLSDHLHLLLSIATRLWSCAHTGLQRMPETGSVQNMSRLKVPIKTKLAVMKQLFNVVWVPRRPPPVKMNTYFCKLTAVSQNDALAGPTFPFFSRDNNAQIYHIPIYTSLERQALSWLLCFLRRVYFRFLSDTHPWQRLFCLCAARHGRACRNKSVLRTSPASLSVPPGIEPHYLGSTKHMALRQTGA